MLNPGQLLRLVAALNGGSLVVLCGAGLSAGPPSNVPLAAAMAEACFDQWKTMDSGVDPKLRHDLVGLVDHIREKVGIQQFLDLVPWGWFEGESNQGHEAVADLLICRALKSALTSNYDRLVERCGERRRVASIGALDGPRAFALAAKGAAHPLLKFHGCVSEQTTTVWTPRQLEDAPTKDRLTSCEHWIQQAISDADLVVLGFWSDWEYLNELLSKTLGQMRARSVLVVDPLSSAVLEEKAGDLYRVLKECSNSFDHVQASAADVLNQLREEFSRAWLRRLWQMADPIASDIGLNTLDMGSLYDLRRDAEGVGPQDAATQRVPPSTCEQCARFQVGLAQAGAVRQNAWWVLGGQTIRVVNGAGGSLAKVQGRFIESSALVAPDLVVCVGAENFGVPGNIVDGGRVNSTVRPMPGGGARWVTSEQARTELNL